MRVETPSIHAEQITAHLGLVHPPAGVEQGREERPRAKLGDRQFHLPGGGGHRLGPRAVAAVGAMRGALVALRADHGGGLGVDQARAARPGADAGRRHREPDPGRPGLPGSAWTRPTGSWRASWVHSLVNLGRRTGAPTMPAALTGRRTPRRRGPAGIATTLRDAPWSKRTQVVQAHASGPTEHKWSRENAVMIPLNNLPGTPPPSLPVSRHGAGRTQRSPARTRRVAAGRWGGARDGVGAVGRLIFP